MSERYGFLYEPGNEREVCILFGLLMPYLNEQIQRLGFSSFTLYLDEYTDIFPDCTILADKRKLRVEFELYSGNFKQHGHDPKKCDLIVCWKHDWYSCPTKVLELFKVVSEIKEKEGLNLVLHGPKYPDRIGRRWSLEEFVKKLKEKLPEADYGEMLKFINELSTMKGVELQTGRGSKIPTLGIGFKKLGPIYPLAIEATGKAYIAYFNVNVQPPEPLLSKENAQEIRKILGESAKMWHYIKASNILDLISKLKKIIEVMLK